MTNQLMEVKDFPDIKWEIVKEKWLDYSLFSKKTLYLQHITSSAEVSSILPWNIFNK